MISCVYRTVDSRPKDTNLLIAFQVPLHLNESWVNQTAKIYVDILDFNHTWKGTVTPLLKGKVRISPPAGHFIDTPLSQ